MPKKSQPIANNPSIKEMKDTMALLEAMKNSGDLLTALGITDLAAIESFEQLDELLQQASALDFPDKFNKAFGSRGWIMLHRAYSQEMVVKALELHDEGDFDAAELAIVDWFNQDHLSHHVGMRIKNFQAGRDRYDQINEAMALYQEGRYLAAAPLILIICDGFASDILKTDGLFSKDADLSAFDSVVGHETGLPSLIQAFTATAKKTTTQESSLPERHKILHGRALGYGNKAVCAKAWGLLLALIEWAEDKSSEKSRIEETQKRESETLEDVLESHQKTQKASEIIRSFEPFSKPGPFDEAACQSGPEQAVFEFLGGWLNKNYGKMAQYSINWPNKPINTLAGDIRSTAELVELLDFKFLEIRYAAVARCDARVWVRAKTLLKTVEGTLDLTVIAHRDDNEIAVPTDPNIKWTIQQNCMLNIMNARFIETGS